MSYQVLALKYRPQTFEEVVGQPHVTKTLSNAISSDRVAHAILFTGPRGTGKTTIARILAKAMNCEKGPVPLPCNQCKICKDIIEGHCTDVFEIDGASNNSVDQIRDLRENVTYMPSSATYKIYIIDEVHMLSTAAFNALLKTLEEPPEHVMFIFATTEVHKLPATILSRCQRHDLGRISLELISKLLQDLCINEGFEIEKQSLDLIAQEADGSVRDALSLLDRVLSSSSTRTIEPDSVLEGLGILDRQILHNISTAIFENNGRKLIDLIEKINNSGIDLKKFYNDIITHFRNLNIIKICGPDTSAVNITDFEKKKIVRAVSSMSSGFINMILQILIDEESLVRYSSHTRTAIEMVLLKLLEINPGAQIDVIIKKLDHLAKQIRSTSAASSASTLSVRKDSGISGLQYKIEPVHSSTSNNDIQAVKDSLSKPGYPDRDFDTQKKKEPEKRTWENFLKKIEKKFPFMFALLSKGSIEQKGASKIIVTLKNCSTFDEKRIKNKKHELEIICKNFLEKQLSINIVPHNINPAPNLHKDDIRAKKTAFNHPLVIEAQKIFNGEIINY